MVTYKGHTFETMDKFFEGLSCVTINGKCGFVDVGGNIVIDAIYDNAVYFSEGLCPVSERGKWGYIDKGGNVVIDFNFDVAKPFKECRSAVKLNDAWYLIDQKGSLLSKPLNGFRDMSEGLICAQKGDMWGYLDKEGNCVIDFIYDAGFDFAYQRATVSFHRKRGYIDIYGRNVIPFVYYFTYTYSRGLAFVGQYDMPYDYLDLYGFVIINDK